MHSFRDLYLKDPNKTPTSKFLPSPDKGQLFPNKLVKVMKSNVCLVLSIHVTKSEVE